MCVTVRRHFWGSDTPADRAAAFAGAAVISSLVMADWQISQDVEAAMVSAVEALDGAPDLLAVTLHHQWIDVYASAGSVKVVRRCFPRVPFRVPPECDDPEGSATDLAADETAPAPVDLLRR